MDLWGILLDVVILLGVGLLLGVLFERIGQSAILGYLLTGVLLGPNALNFIESGSEVAALAEVGVALLLFAIGLEFSWARFWRQGRTAVGSGAAQVVLTGAIGALIAFVLGLPMAAALALGSIVALSSTASVLRTLSTQGTLESPHGRFSFSILLVQDVAVVPLVLLVSALAGGGSTGAIILGIGKVFGLGVLLVGVLWIVFHGLAPRLLRSGPLHANRELPVLLAVVSGIGSAVACHEVGISPSLGALVAGMLLAQSPFAVQIRADVSALRTLLMTLFFATVGMFADPGWIAANALLVAGTLILVIAGKTAVVWGILRALKVRSETALAAGLCLAQIGEFSFVLVEIAKERILGEDTYRLLVSTTVLSMFLTPTLARRAPQMAALLLGRRRRAASRASEPLVEGHVVVIGYGPAARTACEHIAEQGVELVVIEMNAASVRAVAALGHRAVVGDARHPEVLEQAAIEAASSVLVTIPEPFAATEVVRLVRLLAPRARVIARCRHHRHLAELVGAGAHAVVDEEQRVGRGLVAAWRAWSEPDS